MFLFPFPLAFSLLSVFLLEFSTSSGLLTGQRTFDGDRCQWLTRAKHGMFYFGVQFRAAWLVGWFWVLFVGSVTYLPACVRVLPSKREFCVSFAKYLALRLHFFYSLFFLWCGSLGRTICQILTAMISFSIFYLFSVIEHNLMFSFLLFFFCFSSFFCMMITNYMSLQSLGEEALR